MYILYNSDGSISKKFLNEFIQQGNSYSNVLFVAIKDHDPSDYSLSALVKLPDGTVATLSPGDATTVTIDGTEYSGCYFSFTSDTTAFAGTIQMSISATSGQVVLATYNVVLTINPTGIQSTDPMQLTVAEYQNLIETLQTQSYSKTESDNKYAIKTENNTYSGSNTYNGTVTFTSEVALNGNTFINTDQGIIRANSYKVFFATYDTAIIYSDGSYHAETNAYENDVAIRTKYVDFVYRPDTGKRFTFDMYNGTIVYKAGGSFLTFATQTWVNDAISHNASPVLCEHVINIVHSGMPRAEFTVRVVAPISTQATTYADLINLFKKRVSFEIISVDYIYNIQYGSSYVEFGQVEVKEEGSPAGICFRIGGIQVTTGTIGPRGTYIYTDSEYNTFTDTIASL